MSPDTVQPRESSPADSFDELYRRNPDPWNFAASPYELARYDATIAALNHRSYGRAFEPGCSIGVLTERLAHLCDTVEAVDISPAAVEQARNRCRDCGNVRISASTVADYSPAAGFDLIVMSEIGYYFSAEDLRMMATRLVRDLEPGGTLLAVHWLGHSPDHALSGDQVHEILHALPGFTHEHSERQPFPPPESGFRLDRWVRA